MSKSPPIPNQSPPKRNKNKNKKLTLSECDRLIDSIGLRRAFQRASITRMSVVVPLLSAINAAFVTWGTQSSADLDLETLLSVAEAAPDVEAGGIGMRPSPLPWAA